MSWLTSVPKSILGLFLNNFETLRKQHNDNDNGFVSTRKQEITFLIETRRFWISQSWSEHLGWGLEQLQKFDLDLQIAIR